MATQITDAETPQHYDVAILGGGLAGLTLALQCRQELPQARIAVFERHRFPVREAAFKVGESTVEVATHYFTKVLGLEEHMREDELPKLGLRFFFRAGDNRKIERRLELGGRDFPPTPSYQLDRGRFENYLAERCRSFNIDLFDDVSVTSVEFGRGREDHRVRVAHAGTETAVACRWVADTSGRAAILKRHLGLEKEAPHRANAVWFRVDTRIKVDDWSSDPEWQKDYDDAINPRWLSTNHLMGDGYWVWLIPLASGSTSIGIVADEDMHPLSEFNSRDKALAWLDAQEPQCAEQIRERAPEMQDFLAIRRYSRDCKQLFSSRRWGITGEAGCFLDPFYSPGSDFIGFGNTFLTELIKRDLSGRSNRLHAPLADFLFKRMHYGTSVVYQDQYPLFGNHQVMPVKILWDYMIYWTLSGHVFCHGKTFSLRTYARHFFKLKRLDDLNRAMQMFFRTWHEQKPQWESTGTIDAWNMPVIIDTNRALMDELDDAAYAGRYTDNVAQMETIFWEIIDRSGVDCKIPMKRRTYPKARKGTFDMLFEATARRLEEATAPTPEVSTRAS